MRIVDGEGLYAHSTDSYMDDDMQVDPTQRGMIGVYAIINTNANAVYIGCTKKGFEHRLSGHISDMRHGKHAKDLMQSHWYMYGGESFVFKVVEEIDRVDAGTILDRERYWIENYREFGDICYNAEIGRNATYPTSVEIYEADFNLAVMSDFFTPCKKVPVPTTLPAWLCTEVTRLYKTSSIRETTIYSNMVSHGTAILVNDHKYDTHKLDEHLEVLTRSDNSVIAQIIQKTSLYSDDLQDGKRHTINVATWCRECLEDVGTSLKIDIKYMMRLAMYVSIQQCDTLTVLGRERCESENSAFYKTMIDYKDICDQLVTGLKKHKMPPFHEKMGK